MSRDREWLVMRRAGEEARRLARETGRSTVTVIGADGMSAEVREAESGTVRWSGRVDGEWWTERTRVR